MISQLRGEPNTDVMQIHYTYTKRDVIHMGLRATVLSPGNHPSFIAVTALLGGLAGFVAQCACETNAERVQAFVFMFVLASLAFQIFVRLFPLVLLTAHCLTMFGPRARVPVSVQFHEAGLTFAYRGKLLAYGWKIISHATVKQHGVEILGRGGVLLAIVRANGFASPVEAEQFAAEINRRSSR